MGIAGKLIGTIDINNLNIILDSEISTFKKMVDKIYVNGSFIEKSKCVSFLMEMIYSIIPFKIIPLINFIVDVNELYQLHTGQNLIDQRVINEGKFKKTQFYSKFLGIEEPSYEYLVIMNKLFEYGIPYQRVGEHIEKIKKELPEKFSIHDIKTIIYQNDSMNELKIYFE